MAMVDLKLMDLMKGENGKKEKRSMKKEKMAAKKDQLRDTCSSCHSTTKLRCGGCYVEWFCSPECIKKEWPVHKAVCKKRKSEYIRYFFFFENCLLEIWKTRVARMLSLKT